MISVIACNRETRTARDDSKRTTQHNARRSGICLTENSNRLGAHRTSVIKPVTCVGRCSDVNRASVRREDGVGISDESSTTITQPPNCNIARRCGHSGTGVDTVVTSTSDAAQHDTFTAGESVIQRDTVRRRY